MKGCEFMMKKVICEVCLVNISVFIHERNTNARTEKEHKVKMGIFDDFYSEKPSFC